MFWNFCTLLQLCISTPTFLLICMSSTSLRSVQQEEKFHLSYVSVFLLINCLPTGAGIYESEVSSEPVLEEGLQHCCRFEGKTRKIWYPMVWESQWCTVGLQVQLFHAISFQKKGSPLKRTLNRCAFDVERKDKNILWPIFFFFFSPELISNGHWHLIKWPVASLAIEDPGKNSKLPTQLLDKPA